MEHGVVHTFSGAQALAIQSFISSIEMHEGLSGLTCLIVTESYAAHMYSLVLWGCRIQQVRRPLRSYKRSEDRFRR
jgi:hypothetical protein